MRSTAWLLLFALFIQSCNLVSQSRKPAQSYTETDESVVKVQFPFQTIRNQFLKIASENTFIEKVDYLQMDSVTRILQVGLTVRYPLNALFDEDMPAPRRIDETHTIDLSISFPKAKTLSMTRYLSLTFEKFEIDGKSYLNHFEIVFAVLKTILVNTNLTDYILVESRDSISDDQRSIIKEIIETNALVFNPTLRKVSLKLDFNMFDSLKDFSELQDIRLWQFSPFLFKGTQDIFFRIEAGLGKPSSVWLDEYDERVREDTRTILQVREQLFQEYSNDNTIKSVIFYYFQQILGEEQIDISKLPQNYKNEYESFNRNLIADLQDVLSQTNENFIADPEYEYIQYIANKKNKIKNFVSHLDRRLSIDFNILSQGSTTNRSKPLLVKRISQDALNGGFNFLRDLDYEGYKYLKDAQLIIAPQLPGVIFKGKLNVDATAIMGFVDKKFLNEKIDLPFVEGAEGVPFEVVGEVRFEDNGMLGIDAKSISLFEGSKKISFDRNDKNSAFILDFIKLILADSMSTLAYEQTDNTQSEEQRIEDFLEYLVSFQELYSGSNSGQNQIFQNITESLKKDIFNNPFTEAGEEYIEKKADILYGHIFKYDQQDKQFKIHVDPSIISDNIQGARHNLQVWNISPINSRDLNNTFLEIAVGQGVRPQSYVEELYYRQHQLDNSNFSGIYNDLNRSRVDMLVSINYQYLELSINKILAEIIEKQNASEHGNIESKLEEDTEQEYNIVDHIKTNINNQSEIELELHATRIKKEKKGFLWKKWKVTRDPVSIKAKLKISSKKLSDVKTFLKDHPEKLYLSDQVLSFVPHKVELKMGRPSLANSILNKIAKINFQSSLGGMVKRILLKFVNSHFNKTYRDSNDKKILGDSLNEMARVFTTTDEIILILNPRMAGAAFELKLTGEDNFHKSAIKYDQANQTMHIAFSTAPQMAKTDKKQLLDLAFEVEELMGPFLGAKNKSSFRKLLQEEPLIANKIVVETSESKQSLYNKIIKTMSYYDQVLQTVNIPYQAVNDDRKLSTNASELMYFAATSYILYNRLYKFTKKIEDYRLQSEVHNFNALIEARTKLYHNIFKPLMIKYRDEYHTKNKMIKESKISYWNSLFYPDAYFSEAIFLELLKEGIR